VRVEGVKKESRKKRKRKLEKEMSSINCNPIAE
jgi:hypothetical protein